MHSKFLRISLGIMIVSLGILVTLLWQNRVRKAPKEDNRILNVAQFLANPRFDREIQLMGEVGAIGQLRCPCFELTSGGRDMTVWYGVPEAPATIGDITNGGSVIVRGHFRISPAQSGGDFLAYAIRKHESAKEAVARLFSEKYGTAADEVRVSIWQEIPNYVFGDVDIPNELYTHTFLASYTEDEWTIVHDINGGISCKTRWELGFPEQIAANCVE